MHHTQARHRERSEDIISVPKLAKIEARPYEQNAVDLLATHEKSKARQE